MKGDFISCYLLLQPTLRNVSCEKNKLGPNNGIIAQLSKCTQVIRSPLLYLVFHLAGCETVSVLLLLSFAGNTTFTDAVK